MTKQGKFYLEISDIIHSECKISHSFTCGKIRNGHENRHRKPKQTHCSALILSQRLNHFLMQTKPKTYMHFKRKIKINN